MTSFGRTYATQSGMSRFFSAVFCQNYQAIAPVFPGPANPRGASLPYSVREMAEKRFVLTIVRTPACIPFPIDRRRIYMLCQKLLDIQTHSCLESSGQPSGSSQAKDSFTVRFKFDKGHCNEHETGIKNGTQLLIRFPKSNCNAWGHSLPYGRSI